MKFRKKPVVIEALQLRQDNRKEMRIFADVGRLTDGKPEARFDVNDINAKIRLYIPTLEGDMLAVEGDWIIRGVKGELYPCKPDIFEQTYEPVED